MISGKLTVNAEQPLSGKAMIVNSGFGWIIIGTVKVSLQLLNVLAINCTVWVIFEDVELINCWDIFVFVEEFDPKSQW